MRLTKLLIVFLLVGLVGKAQNGPADWYNDGEFTHTITTAAQLVDLAKRVNGDNGSINTFEGCTILLGNDIDLTQWLAGEGNDENKGWNPIGLGNRQTTPGVPLNIFNGIFDGQGHTIFGLWINRPNLPTGLFCYTGSSAKIQNLTIEIDNGTSEAPKVGMKGIVAVGGLVAYNKGSISNCSVISKNESAGTMIEVYGYDNTNLPPFYAGGMVGYNYGSITNSYTSGTITGADAATKNRNYKLGGLAGSNQGDIINCYATGSVINPNACEAASDLGGLIGLNDLGGSISYCYATGEVNKAATDVAGGLIGNNIGTIANCYFQGESGTGVGNEASGTDRSISDIKNLSDPAWDFAYTWTIDKRIEIRVSDRINGGAPYLQMRDISWYDNSKNSFTLTTAAQLAGLAQLVNKDGHSFVKGGGMDTTFVLGNDIDLEPWLACNGFDGGAGWTPIGNSTNMFNGIFDGQGHTISKLWIDRSKEENVGLFGYTYTKASIIDLTITIDNTNHSGVYGGNQTGGLAGYSFGSIKCCAVLPTDPNKTMVKGNNDVGGLTGHSSSSVSYCYAAGKIEGRENIGGLEGYSLNTITNSYATGNVAGTGDNIGGLVGEHNIAPIKYCYAIGAMTGTGSNIGGLIGLNGVTHDGTSATITDCFYQNTTNLDDEGKGAGRTSVNMKNKDNYPYNAGTKTGWDFTGDNENDPIWKIDASGVINKGYPYLYWQNVNPTHTITITNAAELANLSQMVYEGHTFEKDTVIVLANNIDLTEWLATTGNNGGKGWMPIGKYDGDPSEPRPATDIIYTFNGIFDGKGYAISGLWINRGDESSVGLFGSTGTSARILNLTVAINTDMGGVKGNKKTGGLVGQNMGEITDCGALPSNPSKAMVTGTTSTGGLAGYSLHPSASISNSFATGNVEGTLFSIGGLVGDQYNGASISNSYATGNVTGIATTTPQSGIRVGGLVGLINGSNIENSYATGKVEASKFFGGLVGVIYKTEPHLINNSFFLQAAEEGGVNYGLKGVGNDTDDNLTTGVTAKPAASMREEGTFTGGTNPWSFDEPSPIWAIDESDKITNQGFPYFCWQLPKREITLEQGDHFTYKVNDVDVAADANTFHTLNHGSLSFSLAAAAGYKAGSRLEVKAGDKILTADDNGVYTICPVSADLVVTVKEGSFEIENPTPVITYHTLTLSVGEGIMTDKTKNSFQIESGNPFSFVITLAEGYEGLTPTVTVNGRTKGLISIGTEKWRCILSEIFEDTRVSVSFNATGNETPDASRLYSRGGQLFIETPVATTVAVYTMTGQTVVSRSLPEGLTSFPLAKGIYIVKLGERVEKITVGNN